MPWPYPGDRTTERCPCCDREIPVYLWETFLIAEASSYWTDKPRRVVCVDQHGKAVRKGYAATVKFHDGPIYVAVLRRPDDWKHGWWWPLDRVLWEIEKGGALVEAAGERVPQEREQGQC